MADTKTTIVNPNYSYTGQAPRQVRADDQFIAPQLQLGGRRTAAPVTGDQTQYGRPGQGGEQSFFTREAPDPMMYAAPQKPLPISPDKAGAEGLADLYPDPTYGGQNPGGPRTPVSGGPAARGNAGVGQTPTAMFQPTVDQVASKRPTAMGQTMQAPAADDGWGAAASGIAKLGGGIMSSVNGSNDAFDAAVAGKDPGAQQGGWRGKMSDAVNGLMGGHDRKSIQYAQGAGKALQATAPQVDTRGMGMFTLQPNVDENGNPLPQLPGEQVGTDMWTYA